MLKGFRDFVLRGNVVDLAVAVIIGAAFNAIVNTLVGDVLNPLIAATIGKPDFSKVILPVHGGGQIKVGNVFNAAVSFFIVAAVVYFCIVMPMHYFMNRLKKNDPVPPQPPTTKTCTECLSEIPLQAKRCAHCGQPQPAPEAQPLPEPETATSAVAG